MYARDLHISDVIVVEPPHGTNPNNIPRRLVRVDRVDGDNAMRSHKTRIVGKVLGRPQIDKRGARLEIGDFDEEFWSRTNFRIHMRAVSHGEAARLNDNITHAVLAIFANEGRYALTGAAIRRIVYRVTGRDNPGGSGWVTGFSRQVGQLWTKGTRKVLGHSTYVLTDEGRARLDQALTNGVRLDAYDAACTLDFEEIGRYIVCASCGDTGYLHDETTVCTDKHCATRKAIRHQTALGNRIARALLRNDDEASHA